jgi:hypothetical protein
VYNRFDQAQIRIETLSKEAAKEELLVEPAGWGPDGGGATALHWAVRSDSPRLVASILGVCGNKMARVAANASWDVGPRPIPRTPLLDSMEHQMKYPSPVGNGVIKVLLAAFPDALAAYEGLSFVPEENKLTPAAFAFLLTQRDLYQADKAAYNARMARVANGDEAF